MGRFNFGKDCQKEERKYNINKFLLDEDYDYIIELINSLEGYLTRKTDDELTHQLLNPKLREDWVLLLSKLYYVCTTPVDYTEAETEYNKQTYLGLILRLKNIESRISDVSSRMTDTYQYLARLYGVGYRNDISKIVDRLVDAGYINEEDKEEEKTDRKELEENFINKSNIMLRHSLYAIKHEINGYSSGCTSILSKVLVNDDAIMKHILEESLRDYAYQVYEQTERNLKHEAEKFKERRNAPLTPEVWGYVLENENRAIELARDGKLTSEKYIDDEHYEGFSDESKKQMEESFPLMQKILDIGMDDSLFDLEYGLESHVNLLSALNVHNLDVFHELVLRHNIIRCGAFPSLEDKYKSWRNNDVDAKENQREPSVLFTPDAMKLWKKLQDAGYVDEEYKPIVSQKRITVVALAMGEVLGLNPLWQPFEELWGIENASSQCSQARNNTQYGKELYDEVKHLLRE